MEAAYKENINKLSNELWCFWAEEISSRIFYRFFVKYFVQADYFSCKEKYFIWKEL